MEKLKRSGCFESYPIASVAQGLSTRLLTGDTQVRILPEA
jgi:hypothetical protein